MKDATYTFERLNEDEIAVKATIVVNEKVFEYVEVLELNQIQRMAFRKIDKMLIFSRKYGLRWRD